MYYYDIYGWYSETPIEGRSTDIAPPTDIPPDHAANFSGVAWEVILYTPPISDEQKIEAIKQQALIVLQDTDWTGAQGVDNPLNVPYLGNLADFNKCRAITRDIYLNPKVDSVIPEFPGPEWIYPKSDT